jgi:hypothetical protein
MVPVTTLTERAIRNITPGGRMTPAILPGTLGEDIR